MSHIIDVHTKHATAMWHGITALILIHFIVLYQSDMCVELPIEVVFVQLTNHH